MCATLEKPTFARAQRAAWNGNEMRRHRSDESTRLMRQGEIKFILIIFIVIFIWNYYGIAGIPNGTVGHDEFQFS
jgi:zona occludens toxin (predicted ATPase)